MLCIARHLMSPFFAGAKLSETTNLICYTCLHNSFIPDLTSLIAIANNTPISHAVYSRDRLLSFIAFIIADYY